MRSSARASTKRPWTCCPAAPGTRPAMSLPTEMFTPVCSFLLPSGNVRRTKFVDIWRDSPQLKEVRSITLRDMPSCSQCTHGATCTRCPGLAYLEGNMRGPSYQDCEKSYARTGIPSENFKARNASPQSFQSLKLVQIQGLQPVERNFTAQAEEVRAVGA